MAGTKPRARDHSFHFAGLCRRFYFASHEFRPWPLGGMTKLVACSGNFGRSFHDRGFPPAPKTPGRLFLT